MCSVIGLWIILCFVPLVVYSVSVEVNGVIDIGPKLNYQYSKFQLKNNKDDISGTIDELKDRNKLRDIIRGVDRKHKDKLLISLLDLLLNKNNKKQNNNFNHHYIHGQNDDKKKLRVRKITKGLDEYYTKDAPKIYNSELNNLYSSKCISNQSVNNNIAINNFILHTYKQSLKVFDYLKNTVNDTNKVTRNKIKTLKQVYKRSFEEYVNQTQMHRVCTNLGTEKVILNTVDTSNRILKRLAVFLQDSIFGTLFNKEINKQKDIEEKHVCQKFKACRSNEDFTDFLIHVFKTISMQNDGKFMQAFNAATEVLKSTDFSNVLNEDTERKFKAFINRIDMLGTWAHRAVFSGILSVLQKRNEPIILQANDKAIANNVVAFREFLDILDKNLSKANKIKEWDEVKEELQQWSEDKREDIVPTMEKIVNNFKEVSMHIQPQRLGRMSSIMESLLRISKSKF